MEAIPRNQGPFNTSNRNCTQNKLTIATKNYQTALDGISKKGYFGETLFYPMMGPDLLPAIVTPTIGMNITNHLSPEVFKKNMKDHGIILSSSHIRNIRKNLSVIEENVNAISYFPLTQRLADLGLSPTSKKSVLIKGIWDDFLARELDSELGRYVANDDPLTKGKDWLNKITSLLKKGDHLIICDNDYEWVKPLVKVRASNLIKVNNEKHYFHIHNREKISTYFTLPKTVTVIELA